MEENNFCVQVCSVECTVHVCIVVHVPVAVVVANFMKAHVDVMAHAEPHMAFYVHRHSPSEPSPWWIIVKKDWNYPLVLSQKAGGFIPISALIWNSSNSSHYAWPVDGASFDGTFHCRLVCNKPRVYQILSGNIAVNNEAHNCTFSRVPSTLLA